jgi:hypothetical protein
MVILAAKESSLEPRVFGLLGRLTPVCAEASDTVVDKGIVDVLLDRLKVSAEVNIIG